MKGKDNEHKGVFQAELEISYVKFFLWDFDAKVKQESILGIMIGQI